MKAAGGHWLELQAERTEQLGELPQLAGVAGGQHDAHGCPSRPAP